MMWFLTSKMGRTILISLGLVVILGGLYWFLDHRAYTRGMADCQAAYNAAQVEADRDQAKREDAQRHEATQIAKDSDTKAQEATRATDTATAETKEVIRYVYRDPPKTQPVVAGTCVHPLDARVQREINKAVDSANSP